MKITLGYKKYVEEEFELPKKFEFLFDDKIDEDDYTDEQWDLSEEFNDWGLNVTDTEYDLCGFIIVNTK